MMKNHTDSTSDGRVSDPLLEVTGLRKHFPIKGGLLNRTVGNVKAVDGVSFEIGDGETLGLVGESGCGKSTLGRAVLRLHEPTDGQIHYQGTNITTASKARLKKYRREMQIIFQDPAASLNPRLSVAKCIEEPMKSLTDWPREKRRDRTEELIEEVGLGTEHLDRAPHELSGGQQQRVGIARALSINPQFIVADEPTSALDVSVQASILNLLNDLQEEYNLTFLLISHDLSVVRHTADRIAVMYLGKLAEIAPTETLFESPKHPYTKALLSSVPRAQPDPMEDRILLEGSVPSPEDPPSGCKYHTRCQEYIGPVCEEDEPELEEIADEHWCACHHYE